MKERNKDNYIYLNMILNILFTLINFIFLIINIFLFIYLFK